MLLNKEEGQSPHAQDQHKEMKKDRTRFIRYRNKKLIASLDQ